MSIPRLLGMLLAQSLLAANAGAQITLDGSLGPKQALAGPDYTIDSSAGQIRGGNLFHSFGAFNIRTGESATFTHDPLKAPLTYILGRVTGGERSWIDGTLRSTVPGANLYLFNPSGVAFGPNAMLDVPAAFHVSTADYLRFADGARFHADLSKESTLSSAAPAAFGFLGHGSASLVIDRAILEVPAGKTLSVVAGDISVKGHVDVEAGVLRAPGGTVQVAAVASPGEVALGEVDLGVDGFSTLGTVALSNLANLTASGAAGAGTVRIRAGRLLVDNSEINANTTGAGHGAALGIDIHARDEAIFTNGAHALASTSSLGRSGNIRIRAARLQIQDGAFVSSTTLNAGPAGDIAIDVDTLELVDGGGIIAQSWGSSNAGDLDVRAQELLISGANAASGTGLFAGQFSFAGAGNGGDLTVEAQKLTITGSVAAQFFTGILASTWGPGNSGVLSVKANEISVGRNAAVANETVGTGTSGALKVQANSLNIGAGGSISNTTWGPGSAGPVVVSVDEDITVTGSANPNIFTGIFANTFGSGRGGALSVSTGSLLMKQRGSIQAGTLAPGDAGSIDVTTGRLEIASGSGIFTSALFGSGNAGSLTVHASDIVVAGIADATRPFDDPSQFTGFSSATGALGKDGGDLRITARSLLLTDKAGIFSTSSGAGDAGNISITTDALQISGRSAVSSSAFGTGRGGNIDIRSGNLTLEGAGAPRGPLDPPISAIATQAGLRGGAAGNLAIVADRVEVLDGAKVTAQTFGPGPGGEVNIAAGVVVVSGINAAFEAHLRSIGGKLESARAAIIASSEGSFIGEAATGDAGNVRIAAGELRISAGGLLASTTNTPGAGGTIRVLADRVRLESDALVSTSSTVSPNAGRAGDISIEARDTLSIKASAVTSSADQAAGGSIRLSAREIELGQGTSVAASATGAGNAGDISIAAEDALAVLGSVVSTDASRSDGGNIALAARSTMRLADTTVSTSVGGGEGKGGNISIDPQFVIMNRSALRADAQGGSGGNISIVADVFLAGDSTLSASSALSTPGTIDIDARVTDVSGNLTRLPERAPTVAALLRTPCAARLAAGRLNSLVIAAREGLPQGPEGALPSPLVAHHGSFEAIGELSAFGALALAGSCAPSTGR